MNFADTDVDSAYRTELSGIQEADEVAAANLYSGIWDESDLQRR